MRLNRKWLYLGGLVTILTLLLTLTLALPAGAVGTLDEGSLSTDVDYVSPDTVNLGEPDAGKPHPRAVKVTLANGDLNKTQTVERDGDFEAVELTVTGVGTPGRIDPVAFPTVLVNILNGTSTIGVGTTGLLMVEIPDADDDPGDLIENDETPGEDYAGAVAKILPITGAFAIDFDANNSIDESDVGTVRVINPVEGLIEIPIRATLALNKKIVLSYTTSPQETALVNIEGDHGDFDLLTTESPAGPYGEYSSSFVVADSVEINIGSDIKHEQHEVPSELQGNLEIRNEEILARYWTFEARRLSDRIRDDFNPAGAVDQKLGTNTSGSALEQEEEPDANGDFAAGVPNTRVNEATFPMTYEDDAGDIQVLLGSPDLFYAQVANPPMRVTTGTTGRILPDDTVVTGDVDVSLVGATATVVDAVRGIIRVDAANNDDYLSEDEEIEIDYRGSDDFFITVDRGPIQAASIMALETADDGDTNNIGDLVVIPSATNKASTTSDHLRVIEISRGTNCEDCRVRIGVVSGKSWDDDDPVPLPERITVLGINYAGSQRISINDGRAGSVIAVVDDPSTTDEDETVLAVNSTFTGTLDDEPVDGGDGTITVGGAAGLDVQIVSWGGNFNFDTYPLTGIVPPVEIFNDPVKAGAGSKSLVFKIQPDGIRLNVATVDPTDDRESTKDAYIDVVYTVKADADPENALIPVGPMGKPMTPRPRITVAAGSRVAVTSSNDEKTVDVEEEAPTFGNPSPMVDSATGDEAQVVSIDITDDDLAGVNNKSVSMWFRVGNANTSRKVDDDNSYTEVSSQNLEFDDIDGGVRVSVALDDIETPSGRSLRINADLTPTILWYVKALDNAKNRGQSDAVEDDKAKDTTLGIQAYAFTVDGERTEIDQVYTGDWFNPETSRVEGNRRLGVREYLPGASNNTSIRVIFNEALDGSSVSEQDFNVDGNPPLAAAWYAKGDTNPNESPDSSPITASVFLTVAAMAPDATPRVSVVGAISDMAGNATTTGSRTATDGIAPSATVAVDKALSDETVIVTVETDERIRNLTPDLALYVRNAMEPGIADLEEEDFFRVTCDDPTKDAKESTTCPVALRQYADGVDPDGEDVVGEVIASGTELKKGTPASPTELEITLSKGPLFDRNGNDKADSADVNVDDEQNVSKTGATTPNKPLVSDAVSPASTLNALDAAKVFNAKTGLVTVEISEDLVWGDEFTVTYRGNDADPAGDLPGVPEPAGKQVSPTSWTFELEFDRADKYAVVATVEDLNYNRGRGGVGDPSSPKATTFEIDNELAGGRAARTVPLHDSAGSNPVSISDPFFIDLYWDGTDEEGGVNVEAGDESNEYPGDSSKTVTLVKAQLTGPGFDDVDVLGMAVRQSPGSWRMGILNMEIGEYTLKYKAEDSLGNTSQTDRTLTFTTQPVPSWELRLTAGMNLISLPSEPSNGDVNSIFGGYEQVELIFTFDQGQSSVALRNSDDPTQFVGTLKTIDAQHAYWVSATNAVVVEVTIPPTSQLAPPPYLAVKGGQWNLVPVMSLGAVDDDRKGVGAAPGTEVDADAYLGEFRTAFGWTGRSWTKIDPEIVPATSDTSVGVVSRLETGPALNVGRGYWVLYEEDTIITP